MTDFVNSWEIFANFLYFDLTNLRDQIELRSFYKKLLKNAIFFTCCIALMIFDAFSLQTFIVTRNNQLTVFIIVIICVDIMVVFRAQTAFWNKRKITLVLKLLSSKDRFLIRCDEKILTERYQKRFNIFVKLYAANLLMALLPLFAGLFVKILMSGEKLFPFFIAVPKFAYITAVYPFALMFVTWVEYTKIFLTLAFDLLLYGMITALSLKFRILKINFENLNRKCEKEVKKTLNDLIDRHNQLINIRNILEDIFSQSLFVNYILVTFIICFLAFQISIASNVAEIAHHSNFMLSLLLQIFLQCFFGELLKDSSENVLLGVQNCGWENFQDKKLHHHHHHHRNFSQFYYE